MSHRRPGFGAAVGTSFRMQTRRFWRGSKTRLALVSTLPMIALLSAIVLAAEEVDSSQATMKNIVGAAFFALIVYLIPFLFAAGAVAEEVQRRTFTYLASRPASRSAIVIGKLLAAMVATSLVLTACLLVLHLVGFADQPVLIVDELALTFRRLGALLALSSTYCAILLCFGALFPSYPGITGGFFLAVWEFALARFPGRFPLVTVNYHGRVLAGLEDLDPTLGLPLWASGIAVLVGLLVASGFAVIAVMGREYREGVG